MLKWLLAILLVSPTARAERLVERLCFTSTQEAASAIPILNTVLVKGQDEIRPEGLCLNVLVDTKRGELFERWVNARLPHAQVEFSTKNAPHTHCDMELNRKTFREEVVTQYGANGQLVSIQAGKDVLQDEDTTSLRMTSGSPASVQLNQNEVVITCTKKSNARMNLKFAMKTIPQQLPNVYNPSEPLLVAPANATALSTEVEAGPGEEINLGQIVKDLSKETQQVELPPGFTKHKTVGEEKTTWLLKMK